jgi:hypothetical protein
MSVIASDNPRNCQIVKKKTPFHLLARTVRMSSNRYPTVDKYGYSIGST